MNQADVSKLISQLRIKVAPRHRNLKNPDGPEGRILKLRKTVTGLMKHERIELTYNRADEARGYAERLISEAIRHGDCHRSTMEMADFWLLEKQLIHKLFKVFVPRFKECPVSYTRLLRAPSISELGYDRGVLELRGHPYPPLKVDSIRNRGLLHNVLLDEAAKAYRAQKVSGLASALLEKVESEHPSTHLQPEDQEHTKALGTEMSSDETPKDNSPGVNVESKIEKT